MMDSLAGGVRDPKDRGPVLQAVFIWMTNPVQLEKCRQDRK
jgi:hypothetical protein